MRRRLPDQANRPIHMANRTNSTATPPSPKHRLKRLDTRKGKKLQQWSPEAMVQAIYDLYTRLSLNVESSLSEKLKALNEFRELKTVAELHHVPRVTLRRRFLSGKISGAHILGKTTVLTAAEEDDLCQLLIRRQECGWPITVDKTKEIAFHFCEEKERLSRGAWKNRLGGRNNVAGHEWFKGFFKRHPALSKRTAENLALQRALGMEETRIKTYFDFLQGFMDKFELHGKAHRIFNMDETGIHVVVPAGKVLARKGSKTVNRITPKEHGSNTTVVAACNAAGFFLPPMVIFKGTKPRPGDSDNLPTNTLVRYSKSGYIDKPLVVEWFEHFLRHRPPIPDGEPTMLLMDGHASHDNNVRLFELANQYNVKLVLIPSHTSNHLQPLDVAVFRSFKCSWTKLCCNYNVDNPGLALQERSQHYNTLVARAWRRCAVPANAIAGFRKAGICPLDFNAINPAAFAPARSLLGVTLEDSGPSDADEPDDGMAEDDVDDVMDDQEDDVGPDMFIEEVAAGFPCRRDCSPTPADDSSSDRPVAAHDLSESFLAANDDESDEDDDDAPSREFRLGHNGIDSQNDADYQPQGDTLENSSASYMSSPVQHSTPRFESFLPRLDQNKENAGATLARLRKPKGYLNPTPEKPDPSKSDTKAAAGAPSDWQCGPCGAWFRKEKRTQDWLKCMECGIWQHENCGRATVSLFLCAACAADLVNKFK